MLLQNMFRLQSSPLSLTRHIVKIIPDMNKANIWLTTPTRLTRIALQQQHHYDSVRVESNYGFFV